MALVGQSTCGRKDGHQGIAQGLAALCVVLLFLPDAREVALTSWSEFRAH